MAATGLRHRGDTIIGGKEVGGAGGTVSYEILRGLLLQVGTV